MAKKNLKLTIDEVKQIAHLANLSLTDEEARKFSASLSETLSFIEKIKKIDTKGFKPTSQVTGLENRFRDDEILPSLSQKEVLSAALTKQNGFFIVKRVLGE